MLTNIFMGIAGIGALLIGFKLLSDNIAKLSTNGLKALFAKINNNKMLGVGIGTAVTGIIQSSAATSIIVVGFVNSGILTLSEAVPIIMGANIGTTVTAQLAALSSFEFSLYFLLFTFIGIFAATLFKKEKPVYISMIIAALGLVFLGLKVISVNLKVFTEMPEVQTFLSELSNPFLLVLFGIVITAIMQSSSAVTSIVVSMVGVGFAVGGGGNGIIYLILGSNIGKCVPVLFSSIGTSANAKRTALIHLMFNILGTLAFFIILLCWGSFYEDVLIKLFPRHPETQVAMFHTFFNVVSTLALLPATGILVRIANFLIKDDKKPETEEWLFKMDERLLTNPAVAVNQLKREVVSMADKCMITLHNAMDYYFEKDCEGKVRIDMQNEAIAQLARQITDYLVKVSAQDTTLDDEKTISDLHHAIADVLRISEVADNITKYTKTVNDKGLVFSETVTVQLKKMLDKLDEQYNLAAHIFLASDKGSLKRLDAVEDEVDAMRRTLVEDHIKRLNDGLCNPQNSSVFINLVSNLERVGDHLTFFAHSVEQ